MKKFIYKVSIYILIVASIIAMINYVYVKKKAYSNAYNFIPREIEICNLGSSHGVHSYYYKDLEADYTCFNFALSSQTLSYDYRLLKYYQDYLKPGGVVIVDISFFAPWGYPENTENDFESKNKRYYDILPPSMIKDFDLYTYIMVKIPSLNAGILDVGETILSPIPYDNELPKSYPEIDEVVDTEKLDEDVEASCERHIYTNRRNSDGELFINDEEVQALYDIVDICRSHDVTPVFVTCPYLKEYTDEIRCRDEDFFEQFYSWIYTVSKQTGVEYYDYSLDERFIYDYTLFFNGDHLNSAGAQKFTDILFDEVVKDILNQ